MASTSLTIGLGAEMMSLRVCLWQWQNGIDRFIHFLPNLFPYFLTFIHFILPFFLFNFLFALVILVIFMFLQWKFTYFFIIVNFSWIFWGLDSSLSFQIVMITGSMNPNLWQSYWMFESSHYRFIWVYPSIQECGANEVHRKTLTSWSKWGNKRFPGDFTLSWWTYVRNHCLYLHEKQHIPLLLA